ncbi:MAG TPA: hypothetical protein VFV60_05570 [bacterium]|nr:hypothetical protein [bacterium]
MLIHPDIVVRRDGIIRLVADTKYKVVEPEEYKHHDIYQILAYCTALHVPSGLLIYPLHATEIKNAIQVRNAEVEIRRITVDLGGDLPILRTTCSVLAEEVFDWAGVERSAEGKAISA